MFSGSISKIAIVFAVAIAFCQSQSAGPAYAKTKVKYGTLRIQSNPAGLPLLVDGKSFGQTTTDFQVIDLEPGVHTITLKLPSGELWTRDLEILPGRIKCVSLNYKPGAPAPKSPCPFPLNISAPSQVAEGEIITYTADVSYGGNSPLAYTWTISPANARILSGAGTPTITVDSTGLAGRRIEATLVVDDGSGDAVCRQVSRASTYVPPPPPRESSAKQFDVCCSCSYDDQKARLDNLAVELQNDPSTTAYIIAYAGRRSRAGQADRLNARARDYIVTQRGVDSSRIAVMNGGFREEDCVELWVVPSGAKPPKPTPTVQAGDARPTSEPIRKRSGM
jgi:hypothetical protein